MQSGYRLRPYQPQDASVLCRVEYAADQRFAEHGYPQIAGEKSCDAEEFAAVFAEATLTVAVEEETDLPVGYAAMQVFGEHLYLRQMTVDPDHGRKGIGTALLRKMIAIAGQEDFPAIWLSTFRDVPFNMPFYLRHGFQEIPLCEADTVLIELFEHEVPEDVNPAERALLRLTLG